jgi:hypothetical protein
MGLGTAPTTSVPTLKGTAITTAGLKAFTTWPSTQNRSDALSVGFSFVPSVDISVTKLGRHFGSNANNHKVQIWQDGVTGAPVATGTILVASSADANGYKWVSITPVTLTAGTTYRIAATEDGTDSWYDAHSLTGVLDTTHLTAGSAAYESGADAYPTNLVFAGNSYSTPTFEYSYTAPATTNIGAANGDIAVVHGALQLAAASNPVGPTSGGPPNFYFKGTKLVIQYNDGGTVRYKTLDLTSTGVTWVHSTSAP